MKINIQEWKYIGLIGTFLFGLFCLFSYTTVFTKIETLNPIIQFFLINVGIYFLIYFVFKVVAMKKGMSRHSLSLVFLFLAIDNIMPEYHVSITGLLVKGAELGLSTTDYFFGYVWSLFGISGTLLWIFTYVVSTLLLFVGAAYLERNFVKRL